MNFKDYKKRLVALRGGRCEVCGYVGDPGLYDFHHINPALKVFNLSRRPKGLEWPDVLQELAKCVMVCAICHRRLHLGQVVISTEVLEKALDAKLNLYEWLA